MTTATPTPTPSSTSTPSSASPPPPPSVHLRVVITWLAVYPSILAVQAVLSPFMGGAPGAVRLLAITALVVPAVVYVLVPWMLRARAGLLQRRRRRR